MKYKNTKKVKDEQTKKGLNILTDDEKKRNFFAVFRIQFDSIRTTTNTNNHNNKKNNYEKKLDTEQQF